MIKEQKSTVYLVEVYTNSSQQLTLVGIFDGVGDAHREASKYYLHDPDDFVKVTTKAVY